MSYFLGKEGKLLKMYNIDVHKTCAVYGTNSANKQTVPQLVLQNLSANYNTVKQHNKYIGPYFVTSTLFNDCCAPVQ